jgi:very-short-patch-repair endonuclease
MDTTADSGLRFELEKMRARLLDLSARNALLNYTHPRASSLRIVDEVPALVLESLLSNGGFRFAPLPEQEGVALFRQTRGRGRRDLWSAKDTDVEGSDSSALLSQSDRERREAAKAARERRQAEIIALAESVGINPSYDLPAVDDSDKENHGDRHLQTLLVPDDLESRLQKIQAAAVTAIQESGANKLHLLFGFVEWTDIEGGKARISPLVLLPVSLTRLDLDLATHTFPYIVKSSGEDWSTNVTLQEKCRREFGFVLPSIEPEENLEVYYRRIEDVLKSAPRGWRVRRQLTLGLVSFGKILMWRDLDPATWPQKAPLLGNSLFCDVLGFEGDADPALREGEDDYGDARSDEYSIDDLPPELGPVPPTVVPADSSQHSVLVDVQHGDNLVVQGPPGTGKSQTITNIIADAIAARKRVLFVAEKKAALEVVARRLNDSGLGPFCLPLHSHTSNKREFLDGLKERLDIPRTGNQSGEIRIVDELLRETRAVLTGHSERLHSPFGSLGDTAFSILWRVRRLGSEMPGAALEELRTSTISNAISVTPGELARQRATIKALAGAHEALQTDVSGGVGHPWDGVTRADLGFDLIEAVLVLAEKVRASLAAAENARIALEFATGEVSWPETTFSLGSLLQCCIAFESPEHSAQNELIRAVHFRAGEARVRAGADQADRVRQTWARIMGPWGKPGALTPETAQAQRGIVKTATDLFGGEKTADDLMKAVDKIQEVSRRLQRTEELAAQLTAALDTKAELPVGLAVRLIDVSISAADLPDGALALRSPALNSANARERVKILSERAAALRKVGEKLDILFPPEMRAPVVELRQAAAALVGATRFFPTLFSRSYRRAVTVYRTMTGGKSASRAAMTADVDALLRHMAAYTAFIDEPALGHFFGAAVAGVHSPFAETDAILHWTKNAGQAFRGHGEAGHLLSAAVWSATAAQWADAGALAVEYDGETSESMLMRESLANVDRIAKEAPHLWEAESFAAVRQRLAAWRIAAEEGAKGAADGQVDRETPLIQLLTILEDVQLAWKEEALFATHESTFRELEMPIPSPIANSVEPDPLTPIRAALRYLTQFEEPGLPVGLVDWLASGDASERITVLKHHLNDLTLCLAKVISDEGKFVDNAGIDLSRWYEEPADHTSLTARTGRFDRALRAKGSLSRYVTKLRAQASVVATSLPAACALLEKGLIAGDQLPDVYDYVLARTLAEMVLRERPELDQFSGALHEIRRAQFIALDKKYQRLTQLRIAENAAAAPRIGGNRYGQVRDLTEESLIRHEIDKIRAHIPIREMFRRAGRAIQALKPCFMMGPQAVAQYLPPGLFQFDLVVMDEASQMRPEDALGAIARGSQLVVVGDPKQLGPTSFFDTHTEDEDEIEEAAAVLAAQAVESADLPPGASVLQRSESILLAAARRYPMRMLRWHYRSRYPQLIAFSNKEFYGDDLILFPHPGTERPDDAINFRGVQGAVYSSSLNRKEAEEIVEAVRIHAAEHPERTLLVVTMNQPQRELIDTLIQNAEKDDSALAAFRARHADTLEPFGVKNLENVQGDERDVIYISVTYGPNAEGVVAQNFGPVNATGGERRLNVLFTRAKYRLDIFCSFDPVALRVTESSPRGLCVLRDYLRYAKEGTLSGGRFTAREPDSDFEIEVARALRGYGYDVHVQVGVAGYFLDMAVVDPKFPGRYLLAIECDGATYHSAKSARDRDRLRQGVLETLGWNVHRIWSTDWFRDPREETQKVIRRIEALLAGANHTVVTASTA